MKKQLITKQLIDNIKNFKEYSFKKYIISLLGGLFVSFVVMMLIVHKFDLEQNNLTKGISIFIGLLFTVPFILFFKEEDTSYSNMNYYIAEDILLEKFVGTIKRPVVSRVILTGMRVATKTHYRISSYHGYILRFLHSGDFILPSKKYNKNYFKDYTIYDFARREDRFYVLVDSNNVIKEIFDTRLFDISLDDFELIENKYYPKKQKVELSSDNEK